MRTRAFRRHATHSHMWRRIKEDRNQHYNDLTCACYEPKGMAKFKEQPKLCSCSSCSNQRQHEGMGMQERRHLGITTKGRRPRAKRVEVSVEDKFLIEGK